MDDKILTTELEHFDFSECHPIKEKLLQELLTMHRRDQQKNRGKFGGWAGKLSDEELDWAAAAGNPHLQDKEKK